MPYIDWLPTKFTTIDFALDDGDLLASYAGKYGAVARVRFTAVGCVG